MSFCIEKHVSTSLMHKGYVPSFLLRYYEVYFRGREMTVKGPEGLKCADAEQGFVVLNNGRKLHGEVLIKSFPVF